MIAAPVQTLPAITSVEDAIEAVYARVFEFECSVHEAVCDLWPNCRFDQLAVESLAIDGLAERARREKHQRSDGQHGKKTGVAWGAPHGRKWHDYLNSLTHPYTSATGLKPLFEFDLADLAALALFCRTRAAGLTRRADWASETQAVLESAGKDRISDLPAAELKSVAEAATEAFRRPE